MTKQVKGTFIQINNEEFYKIENYDCMDDFFMTMISSSDVWNFCWSKGGLTAGRIDCDHAIFPYYTADKVSDAKSYTGPFTKISVGTETWQPFSSANDNCTFLERNLYKNIAGTKIIFEEINKNLQIAFKYSWSSSSQFGLVRNATIQNLGSQTVELQITDGCQNILPSCVTADFQNNNSVLLDAYKKTEVEPTAKLAIFTVSSIVTDKAEPNEGLYANVCWFNTEDTPILDLANKNATVLKGRRPACFIQKQLCLKPQQTEDWYQVFDTNLDSCKVADLCAKLQDRKTLTKQLIACLENGTKEILEKIAQADGIQHTAEKSTTVHHSENVLFNIMRGGIFADNGKINVKDFVESTKVRNKTATKLLEKFLQNNKICGLVEYSVLKEAIFSTKNFYGENFDQIKRLFLEYMPLTFSRRHGDPSRPWNRFSIKIQNDDGTPVLNYEGNWRDIFQNWEALVWSYPEYIENMCAKFLNATTLDGFNPYRITRQGLDWEVPDPDNPWAQIGYWGDHQVIYFEKLLEFILKTKKEYFLAHLNTKLYTSSLVPYKIAKYSEILKDPRNTILFDKNLNEQLINKTKEFGTDAKLALNGDHPYLVSVTAKMLQIVIAKISNLVPGGGIWLNTQRPEWNDANNALAGYGLSVVTTCYLRRFLKELLCIYQQAPQNEFDIPTEIFDCFVELGKIFEQFEPTKTVADSALRFDFTKQIGLAFEKERNQFYKNGYSEKLSNITKSQVCAILTNMLNAVEVTIKQNKRKDGLYHAYNTMKITDSTMELSFLQEMLEGQVAVLSSGLLSGNEVLELTKTLKQSPLYESRQNSYMLYPNKELPTFMQKNLVANSKQAETLAQKTENTFLKQDSNKNWHFNADFKNARILQEFIEQQEPPLSAGTQTELLDLYEQTFNHQNFTGRSGTFFAYEGLGSIYWHMVSKLLLAVQEATLSESNASTKARLAEKYYDIRSGLSFNKSPEIYGAFPQDPYSHTPQNQGAKQPGMTGQVKEEILTRFGELGLSVENSVASFNPTILKKEEFIDTGSKKYLDFTWCGTKIEYNLVSKENCCIELTFTDGKVSSRKETSLTKEETTLLFSRNGQIKKILVFVSL